MIYECSQSVDTLIGCPECWAAEWHIELNGDMTCTECGETVNYWASMTHELCYAIRERSRIEDGALN